MIVQWHGEKYPPVWRCIYCGETDQKNLQDEHIIPFSLLPRGGDWFLPKSSCGTCADITKRFEGQVLGGMFGPLREQLGLKTRHRGVTSKKTGRMSLRKNSRDGRIWDEEIEVSSFPKLCMGFRWLVPGILMGHPPTNQFAGKVIAKCNPAELDRFASDVEAFRIARVGPLNFARMLAKIAHSYAIAKYGFDSFDEPLLLPLILGSSDCAPYLVGGDATPEPPPQPNILHDVFRMDCRRDAGPTYLGIAIRLFGMIGMPRYHVIVGRRLKEAPAVERSGDTIAVTLPIG